MRWQKSGGETTLLFVYGTLRRGFRHPMARLLALHGRFLGAAQMEGRLYRVGSYPALGFAKRAQERISGDLYDLAGLHGLLARLDRYEGIGTGAATTDEYRRVALPVELADGTRRLAWVYLYNRPVAQLPYLISGDWLRQRRRQPLRK